MIIDRVMILKHGRLTMKTIELGIINYKSRAELFIILGKLEKENPAIRWTDGEPLTTNNLSGVPNSGYLIVDRYVSYTDRMGKEYGYENLDMHTLQEDINFSKIDPPELSLEELKKMLGFNFKLKDE